MDGDKSNFLKGVAALRKLERGETVDFQELLAVSNDTKQSGGMFDRVVALHSLLDNALSVREASADQLEPVDEPIPEDLRPRFKLRVPENQVIFSIAITNYWRNSYCGLFRKLDLVLDVDCEKSPPWFRLEERNVASFRWPWFSSDSGDRDIPIRSPIAIRLREKIAQWLDNCESKFLHQIAGGRLPDGSVIVDVCEREPVVPMQPRCYDGTPAPCLSHAKQPRVIWRNGFLLKICITELRIPMQDLLATLLTR